jgi:hypothetical protein
MNASRSLTPSALGTTTIAGAAPIIDTPAKSLIGSKARFLLSNPRIEWPELPNNSVYPSAAAVATDSAPTMPPAPGRFITTIC